MRRDLPPLNALKVFEVAARAGSFSAAARTLRIAQPAVTRHVANLEAWIGVALFQRHGNAVSLTAEGAALAEQATGMFDRLELGLKALRRSGEDELVIGASFGLTHLWLMPRVSALRAAVKAPINFLTSEDYRAFEEPAVDISIRFGRGDFPGKKSVLLFAEACQMIAAPGFLEAHPGLSAASVLQHVAERHLLDHGDPRGVGWTTWREYFAQTEQVLPAGTRLQTVHSYPLMLDMVSRGEGIAIGSHGLEDDLVAQGLITRLGPTLRRPGYGYYLVYDARHEALPSFRAIRDHLLQSGSVPVHQSNC